MCVLTGIVGWLKFNVPFQHKYGYIGDETGIVNVSQLSDGIT